MGDIDNNSSNLVLPKELEGIAWGYLDKTYDIKTSNHIIEEHTNIQKNDIDESLIFYTGLFIGIILT